MKTIYTLLSLSLLSFSLQAMDLTKSKETAKTNGQQAQRDTKKRPYPQQLTFFLLALRHY